MPVRICFLLTNNYDYGYTSGKQIDISTLALIQLSLLKTRGRVLFLSTGKRKSMHTLVEHIKKFYNLKVGFDCFVGSIQVRFCQTTEL